MLMLMLNRKTRVWEKAPGFPLPNSDSDKPYKHF